MKTTEDQNGASLKRVVSLRHGSLVFRGCKNHPDNSNSCCAKIRFDQTNEILTTEQVWEIMTEINLMMDIIDKHRRLAAEVRCLLHNGGAGPNLSQLKRCDVMLREIAGLPPEQANAADQRPGTDAPANQ